MAYNYWENNNFLNQTWIPPEGEELSLDFDGGVIPPNVPQGKTARNAGETNVKTDIDAQMRNESFNLGDFNIATQTDADGNPIGDLSEFKEDKTNEAINTINQGVDLWKSFKEASTAATVAESTTPEFVASAEQINNLQQAAEMSKYGIDVSGDITSGALASSAATTAGEGAGWSEAASMSVNEAAANLATEGAGETAATEAGKKAAEEGSKKAAEKAAEKAVGKVVAGVAAAKDIYEGYKIADSARTKNDVKVGAIALKGAEAGAEIGSMIGPWGTVIGGAIGGVVGLGAGIAKRESLDAAVVEAQKSGAMAAYGGEISSKMLETYKKQYKEVPLSLEEANNLIAQYGEKIPEGSFAYGGSIHIKPENRGKFTKYCGGKVTGDCIKKGLQSKDAHIRQMANFARNARKWKKYAEGGDVDGLVRAVDNGEGKFMSTDAGMMVGVEMEKGEMYTTPDGETKEVEGKTHEEGGTKMAVPDGSYVWSDRISAITGETIKKGDKDSIAHAVKKEMKKIERLEKILKEDTTDKIHKNTYKRQMEISQQELLRLKALQDLHEKREKIKKAMFNHLEKGDKADMLLSKGSKKELEKKGDGGEISRGDRIGNTGVYIGAMGKMLTTMASRLTDSDHRNYYLNVGEEAKRSVAKGFESLALQKQQDEADIRAMENIQRRNAYLGAGNASAAQSLGDLAYMRANASRRRIESSYSQREANLYKTLSNIAYQSDVQRSKGATERDLYNEKAKDAFYTGMNKDYGSISLAMQANGRNLNESLNNRNKTYLQSLGLEAKTGYGITIEDGIVKMNKGI